MSRLLRLLTIDCDLAVTLSGKVEYQHSLGALNVSLADTASVGHALTISDITFDLAKDRTLINVEVLQRRDEWEFDPGLKAPTAVTAKARLRLTNVTGHLVEDSETVRLIRNNGDLCIQLWTETPKQFFAVAPQVIAGLSGESVLVQLWITGL